MWGISSNGRALALHARGSGTDTRILQTMESYNHFCGCYKIIGLSSNSLKINSCQRAFSPRKLNSTRRFQTQASLLCHNRWHPGQCPCPSDFLAKMSNCGLKSLDVWFHGVMVSTLDSESSDPSSNLGGTCEIFLSDRWSEKEDFAPHLTRLMVLAMLLPEIPGSPVELFSPKITKSWLIS